MVHMTSDIKNLIGRLSAERDQLDEQIEALQGTLKRLNGTRQPVRPSTAPAVRKGRQGMSAARRKAVSRWMKAYWARRRAAAKGKARAA